MNTLIVSTFDCSFEDFDKFVADFHEKEGHKYVEEYELIKVNDHKSHLILKVKDLEEVANREQILNVISYYSLLYIYYPAKFLIRKVMGGMG